MPPIYGKLVVLTVLSALNMGILHSKLLPYDDGVSQKYKAHGADSVWGVNS